MMYLLLFLCCLAIPNVVSIFQFLFFGDESIHEIFLFHLPHKNQTSANDCHADCHARVTICPCQQQNNAPSTAAPCPPQIATDALSGNSSGSSESRCTYRNNHTRPSATCVQSKHSPSRQPKLTQLHHHRQPMPTVPK